MSREPGGEVEVDLDQRLLTIRMWGFWNAERMEVHERDLRAAVAQFGPGGFDVLADLSDFPAQSQEISVKGRETIQVVVQSGGRRIANVMNAAMAEFQVKRLEREAGASSFRYFRDLAQAQAWLLSDPAEATSAQ